MTDFIENLFSSNNSCLTASTKIPQKWQFHDILAFFDDGRLLIDENKKYYGNALNFEVWVTRNFPNITLKKEYVSAEILHKIYEKALKKQKNAKEMAINILKIKAKRLKKKANITHSEALEKTAFYNDFGSWKKICIMSEEQAKNFLDEEKDKEKYINKIHNRIKSFVADGISQAEAEEEVAEHYNFASLAELENCSLKWLTQTWLSKKI